MGVFYPVVEAKELSAEFGYTTSDLGFFEFVHNVRRRGKALLGSIIELLVSKDPGSQ
jgi:hypothetical protein